MTPKATLISYDSSVYNDLIFLVVLLCLGMAICSCWLVYRKSSCRFQSSAWGGFLLLLLLGSLGLCTFIYAQRLTWRDTCAKLVASYANMIGKLDHWKIQPGDPKFFSDWSEPFVLSADQQPLRSFSEGFLNPRPEGPILEKLAVPEGLAAGWRNNFQPELDPPSHVQRRNQWAIAALTQDSEAYRRSTKQICVRWEPVPQATTYRLQWGYDNGEETQWMTVYTGSKPFCVLAFPSERKNSLILTPVKGKLAPYVPTLPTGQSLAFRVRAEGGTPEDDPHFTQIIDILDFPAATNPYVGYAYTMRFVDQHALLFSEPEQLQFIVSPISDANNNGFIDVREVPNDIGEWFPATLLAQYIREYKERAMYFDVFRDKWGKWFVIAEPIWTPDNKMDGFLAMDFRVDAVYSTMFRERIYPLCLFALVMFVYFGAVLVVNHLQMKAAAISRLADELQHTVSELTKAKQETEKAWQVKTLFLNNMSHEFRTPLNAILGYITILSRSSFRCVADERALCMEAIKQVEENGKSLLELVDNVLGVAAMDGAQAHQLMPTAVHLRSLVFDVADTMQSRAEYKALTLTVEEPHDVPEWIESDPARLRQVLMILIGNAIKFTQEGIVSIYYGAVPKEQTQQQSLDMPMFYVSVSDTGIGIEPDYLHSIFKPFLQTDPTLTRQYGGTGIGLAVARQTAEMLHGSISVESQPGCGSIFTFTFPGQPAKPSPQEESVVQSSVILPKFNSTKSAILTQPANPETSGVKQLLAGCRILYVEDTRVNQIVVTTQLRKIGATVETADDGQNGIDKIAKAEAQGEPFDIILMDMQMPVLDGYAATRQLRANDYSKPIIAVTAHALPGDRVRTLAAGCNEHVPKPIDFVRLIETIKAFWK